MRTHTSIPNPINVPPGAAPVTTDNTSNAEANSPLDTSPAANGELLLQATNTPQPLVPAVNTSQTHPPAPVTGPIMMMPVAQLRVLTVNTETYGDKDSIEDLKISIASNGRNIAEPIIITPDNEIISG